MQRYILDTNFLSSLYNYGDSTHDEAINLLSKHRVNTEFMVPFVVIAELCSSKDNFDYIKICRDYTSDFIRNKKSDLRFIQTLDPKLRSSLRANDCLILALCKRYDAKLLTFDKKLLKAYDLLF